MRAGWGGAGPALLLHADVIVDGLVGGRCGGGVVARAALAAFVGARPALCGAEAIRVERGRAALHRCVENGGQRRDSLHLPSTNDEQASRCRRGDSIQVLTSSLQNSSLSLWSALWHSSESLSFFSSVLAVLMLLSSCTSRPRFRPNLGRLDACAEQLIKKSPQPETHVSQIRIGGYQCKHGVGKRRECFGGLLNDVNLAFAIRVAAHYLFNLSLNTLSRPVCSDWETNAQLWRAGFESRGRAADYGSQAATKIGNRQTWGRPPIRPNPAQPPPLRDSVSTS